MIKKVFIVFFVFLFLAFVHLLINAQIIYTGYKIDGLKRELGRLRAENRYLAAFAAQKNNPAKIDAAAKKMGMFIPAKVNFITAEGNSKLKQGN